MRKKILFILPSLKAGGAERVLSFLAKEINKEVFETKLIIIGYEKDVVYNIEGVDTVFLNKSKLTKAIFALISSIRRDKPDVVFSSIGHVNLAMGFFSVFFRKIKFIAREASVVSVMNQYSIKRRFQIPNIVKRFLYSRLTKIICQSFDMKNDFLNIFNLDSCRLEVIGNPITNSGQEILPRFWNTENVDFSFITVGRISPEKGYNRILEGLSKITNYSFKYLIIGGGEFNEIKNLANELNIENNIEYLEYTDEVLNYLSASDFFIQGSFVEGFPNALLESCSVGTPVIAFNCPGGTKEIVEVGLNGFLVNDREEFIDVLQSLKLFENNFDKDTIKQSVVSKYSSEKIVLAYEQLFLSI